MTTEQLSTRGEVERDRKALVVLECQRRAVLYASLTPKSYDSPEIRQQKAQFMLGQLQAWAVDPLEFIKDCGWAPDPTDTFGASSIPADLGSPKGMVPLLPFVKQAEFVATFWEMLSRDGRSAFCAVKSRQVAFTTFSLWCALHAFLFRDSTTGLLVTYEEEYIDKGGKGQRDADSLFGRCRMFLDGLMGCLPTLKFNQHKAPRRGGTALEKWNLNLTGMLDTDDVAMKLSRPRWTVHGIVMFERCEGNWLAGELPGDSVGRSLTPTYIIFDEFGQYDERRAGVGRASWGGTAANTKCRFALGTIPRGGGMGTMFYELMEEIAADTVSRKLWCHWSDIGPYLAGAAWRCGCGKLSDWSALNEDNGLVEALAVGPGREGREMLCAHCGVLHLVRHADMVSPWFLEQCKLLGNDKVAIARELQMDWMSSQGDLFFGPFRGRQALKRIDRDEWERWPVFEGFDPGQNVANPASWIAVAMNPKTMEPHVVGYHMAANNFIEWWVPFFKRWSRRKLERQRVPYGRKAGDLWVDAFSYSEDDFVLLDRMASVAQGAIYGDKYGSHRHMTESPYEILESYGIDVDYEYTGSAAVGGREELARNGREWSGRLTIDPWLENWRPLSPLGKDYPSVFACLMTAKPMVQSGEGQARIDVSKKNPPHVSHLADAMFYMCRGLPETIHAMPDRGGVWGIVEDENVDEKPIFFGERGIG